VVNVEGMFHPEKEAQDEDREYGLLHSGTLRESGII
jgi:hypothetical protein